MTWASSIAVGATTAFIASICFLIVGGQYQQQHVWDPADILILGLQWMIVPCGFAGFIFGIVMSRLVTTGSGTSAWVYSVGGVLGISAVLLMVLPKDHVPYIDQEYLALVVQIRCPKNWNPDYHVLFSTSSPIFHIPSSDGSVDWSKATMEDGSWIVSASCSLLSSREDQIARTNLDGKTPLQFHVPLPSQPTAANEQWGEWTSKEFVDETRSGFSVRARVDHPAMWKRDHPTQPEAEYAAREAKLKALSPADPLVRWLGLFEPTRTRQMTINDQIQNDPPEGPGLAMVQEKISELPGVLRAKDSDTIREAIEAVSLMKTIPPELAPDLITSGRNVTLGMIGEARASRRPGWRDIRADQKAYWFFRKWDENVLGKIALNTTDEEQRITAIDAVIASVDHEHDSFLAELANTAREAKKRRSAKP